MRTRFSISKRDFHYTLPGTRGILYRPSFYFLTHPLLEDESEGRRKDEGRMKEGSSTRRQRNEGRMQAFFLRSMGWRTLTPIHFQFRKRSETNRSNIGVQGESSLRCIKNEPIKYMCALKFTNHCRLHCTSYIEAIKEDICTKQKHKNRNG